MFEVKCRHRAAGGLTVLLGLQQFGISLSFLGLLLNRELLCGDLRHCQVLLHGCAELPDLLFDVYSGRLNLAQLPQPA